MNTNDTNLPQSNQRSWDLGAIFLFFLSVLSYSTISFFKFHNFAYQDWDLGFYAQSMYSLLSGHQYSSLTGINFFGNHSCFIMFLLLPFFYVIPHPLTLEILKIIAFSSAGLFLYKIVKEGLGGFVAWLFMLAYLLFPANMFAVFYDFNPEGFAPICLFGMFYFFKKNRWGAFLFSTIMLMLIKESLMLIFVMFGLYGLLSRDKKNKLLWGWAPLLSGIVLFLLMTFWVIPHFLGTSVYPFVGRYQYLGRNLPEIINTVIHQPYLLWHIITLHENIQYIKQLFGAFLIPALCSPIYLLLVSPLLLQHLLSSAHPEHTIFFHYGFSLVPFIFFAAYQSFRFWAKFLNRVNALTVILLVGGFSIVHIFSFGADLQKEISADLDNKLSGYYWEMVSQVPKDAGVIATLKFQPALSNHPRLFSFHKTFADDFQSPVYTVHNMLNQPEVFETPTDVKYALVDFQDKWIRYYEEAKPKEFFERLDGAFNPKEWDPQLSVEDTILFTRNIGGPLHPKLIEPLPSLPQNTQETASQPTLTIDNNLQLLSISYGTAFETNGQRILPLTLIWQSFDATNRNYGVIFQLKRNNKVEYESLHIIGYSFFSTMRWPAHQYFKEMYYLPLFSLPPGHYSIGTSFYNLKTGRRVLAHFPDNPQREIRPTK